MKYKTFEDFLIDKHATQYVGLDDEMIDDFNDWISELSVEDWLRFGDEYANT